MLVNFSCFLGTYDIELIKLHFSILQNLIEIEIITLWIKEKMPPEEQYNNQPVNNHSRTRYQFFWLFIFLNCCMTILIISIFVHFHDDGNFISIITLILFLVINWIGYSKVIFKNIEIWKYFSKNRTKET